MNSVLLAIITAFTYGLAGAQNTTQTWDDYFSGIPSSSITALKDAANLSDIYELDFVVSRQTVRNTTMVKFVIEVGETYVYGAGITAEFDETGHFTGYWTGDVPNDVLLVNNSTPVVTKTQAMTTLAATFGQCQYQSLFRNKQSSRIFYVDPSDHSMILAWMVSYVFDGVDGSVPTNPHGVISAMNGKNLEVWDGLSTQATTLAAVGGNAGPEGLRTYTDLKVTRLADPNLCQYSSSSVQVQNMRAATGGAFSPSSFPCSQFSSTTADAINGGYSPMTDVARNADIVVQMYNQYTNTNGPLGTLPLLARVHYGVNYENAFWDGTFVNFGDGGANLYPVTSLDIVGHEYGHGFTASFSKLQFSGESGGVSEAFSDMSGQAALFYASGVNDFEPGREVVKNGGGALRYMCDPPLDGRSINNYAQFLTNVNMDPHYSCGLYNLPFCTLAKTPGWDTMTAFQLFAYANQVYWRSKTTFNVGLCGLISAANDLGLDPNQVRGAFAPVGLAC